MRCVSCGKTSADNGLGVDFRWCVCYIRPGEWFDVTPREAIEVIEKLGQGERYAIESVETMAARHYGKGEVSRATETHRKLFASLVDAKAQAAAVSQQMLDKSRQP